MDHAQLILQRGGIRPFARRLGHKHHTKVQGWVERNRIPVEHWKDVVEAGAATLDELTAVAMSDDRPTEAQIGAAA